MKSDGEATNLARSATHLMALLQLVLFSLGISFESTQNSLVRGLNLLQLRSMSSLLLLEFLLRGSEFERDSVDLSFEVGDESLTRGMDRVRLLPDGLERMKEEESGQFRFEEDFLRGRMTDLHLSVDPNDRVLSGLGFLDGRRNSSLSSLEM